MSKSTIEHQADISISNVIAALQVALCAASEAGYGSQVLGPLDDALKAAVYALDTAQGRI